MKEYYFKHVSGRYVFTVKEWRCCGKLWQLLLSKNYKSRHNWSPTCPECGGKGK